MTHPFAAWRHLIAEPWMHRPRQPGVSARPESQRFDGKVAGVLITVAVVLTLQNYLAGSPLRLAGWLQLLGFHELADGLIAFVTDPIHGRANDLIYWALFNFATYFFIPCLVIVGLFRERTATMA